MTLPSTTHPGDVPVGSPPEPSRARGLSRKGALPKRTGSLSARRRRRVVGAVVMLTPAALLALVFFAAPVALVFVRSFSSAPLIGDGRFVGLDNYRRLLDDHSFRRALVFGLEFTALATLLVLPGAYALGVLVRRGRRFVGFFRGVYLVPFVIGLSTLSYMALLEFRPGYGSVNQLLAALGLSNGETAWLLSPGLALCAATLVTAWAAVGFGMVLFMTAMQSVPDELLEAARVDGASWWQRERLVILPMIKRTLALVSVTTVAGNLLAFSQFYILTQGGPGTSTATPVIIAYKTAIQQFRLGYASAMSIVLLVIIAVLSAAQLALLRGGRDA